jgi:hypothetical protein
MNLFINNIILNAYAIINTTAAESRAVNVPAMNEGAASASASASESAGASVSAGSEVGAGAAVGMGETVGDAGSI